MFPSKAIKTAGVALSALLLVSTTAAEAAAIRTDTGFTTSSLAGNDDGSTGLTAFGFTIDFFGVTYSSGYLNNNGNVTFSGPLTTFTPFPIITTGIPMLAPFFADVDTRTGPLMTYGTSTIGGQAAFGVNWIGVCYFAEHCDKTNSFQLVMVDRSDIGAGDFDFEFNFDQIEWETGDASSGTDGLGGSSARVGWSNGISASAELAGSAVNGAFLDGGPAATSLIVNELDSDLAIDGTMGTTIAGRYLYQVRGGTVIPPMNDIPEPGTLALFGLGLAGLGFLRRRRSV